MNISSRTPDGAPNRCPACGNAIHIEPSSPFGDEPCPNCGSLLWFAEQVLGDDRDLLLHEAAIGELAATTKDDALCEIVDRLAAVGAFAREHQESILQAVQKREELGSTAFGHGFAVPHGRHSAVTRLVGVLARSRAGIDFGSLDGQPVHTIFLFISPLDRPSEHLRALQRIARYLRTQQSSK